MKILSLYVEEGMKCKKMDFEMKNLIHSEENTQGKTTSMRLMLHSLGFSVPSPAKIDFQSIFTRIVVQTESKKYCVERYACKVSLTDEENKYTFVLPNDQFRLHALLFNIDELYLLENILGAMYVDQTRGTVVINRGDIIGNNSFHVEKLIAGLEGKNVDELTRKIADEQKKLKEYKNLLEIAKYKKEKELYSEEIVSNKKIINEMMFSSIDKLENDILSLKSKIKNTKDVLSKNNNFINMIEGYKLHVKDKEGNEISVNSNTLIGFSDNKDLLEMQIKLLNIELKNKQKELNYLKTKDKNDKLLNVSEYKESVDEQLKNINIDYDTISKIVDQSNTEILELKKELKEKVKQNSDVVEYTNRKMFECARKLNVDSFLEKNGIFTNKIQNKSGAAGYKVIIAFRVAFIKAIEKYKGIKLPLIIDSLKNSELDEKNAKLILDLLKTELKGHQIIIASIYNFNDFKFDKIYEITYPLINDDIIVD